MPILRSEVLPSDSPPSYTTATQDGIQSPSAIVIDQPSSPPPPYISPDDSSLRSDPPPYTSPVIDGVVVRGMHARPTRNYAEPEIESNFPLALFTTIFCNCCFGVAAVYMSLSSIQAEERGDYGLSRRLANYSKSLSSAGICFTFICLAFVGFFLGMENIKDPPAIKWSDSPFNPY